MRDRSKNTAAANGRAKISNIKRQHGITYCGCFWSSRYFEDPFQHKRRICRALGNSSHQVPVPIGSVRDIHPHPVSFFGKLLLALRSDAVQHLEFKLLPWNLMLADECFRIRNDVIIMCCHRRFMAAQKLQQSAAENEDRLLFIRERNGRRFFISAFYKPEPRLIWHQTADVFSCAVQISLNDGAEHRKIRLAPLIQLKRTAAS